MRTECDCCFDFPRSVLRRIWAFPAIVLSQSRSEIGGNAALVNLVVYLADEDVNIVEGIHRLRL